MSRLHASSLRRWLRRGRSHPLVAAILLTTVVTASAGGYGWVRVHPGQTLTQIAAAHHTSVDKLVALNRLPGNGNLIIAGQRLRVPLREHSGAPVAHAKGAHHRRHGHHQLPAHGRHHRRRARPGHHSRARRHGSSAHQGYTVRRVIGHHVVRAGDSVDRIAAKWHVSPVRIERANRLGSDPVIVIGQRLRIPRWIKVHSRTARHEHHHRSRHRHSRRSHHHSAHHHSGHRHHSAHHHSAHRHHTAHHHHTHRGAHNSPTQAARVAALRVELAHRRVPEPATAGRMVARTAARFGVPTNFALAEAWQESGFNQRAVSDVGAVGVMQVLPSTGAFVSTYVLHRPLNVLRARDNILAGVGLLSVLLRDTHGHEALAAAGYYQGLGSVRLHGEYADTKHYVADVMALRAQF